MMRALRSWFARFGGLFGKRRRDRELASELESHVQMHIDENLNAGMSGEEARRQALLHLGGLDQTKERYRDRRGIPWLETTLQDVRFGLRMLRKNPGFTFVAVLTLALGIGANTAIFSVIDTVILEPLPFASPDRLIWLNGKMPMTDMAAVSPPDFVDYRASNHSFEKLGAMFYSATPSNLVGERSQQVLSTTVSAGFFETVGIRPILGRDFVSADEQVNIPQVVILGAGIWRGQFGGDLGVIGRTIRLDGQPLTVVGVLPQDLPLLSEAQVWLPTPLQNAGMGERLEHYLKVIGRLKPGVTLRQSQADMDSIAARLAAEYPNTNKSWSLRQRPLKEVLIGPVRRGLLLIWFGVGLLLLIACVNVANLLIARSVTRRREFSMRVALGASRSRLIRQTLTESAVIALLGGALGTLSAVPCIRLLRTAGPADVPRLHDLQASPNVLMFTLAISLLTVFVCGLLPAFLISGAGFTEGLSEAASRGPVTFAPRRLGRGLVVAEIAASLTLLVAAGLIAKSFWRLIHVDPGFETAHVISSQLSMNVPAYDNSRRVQFWRKFEEAGSYLPGVQALGATSELPLNGEHSDNPFFIEGHTYLPSQFDDASFRQITSGYFAAMRIPLLAGRAFDDRETETSPGVAIVNRAFVGAFFHGENALGKRIALFGDPQKTREIVGIVANVSSIALSDSHQAEMYVPYVQYPSPRIHIVVRAEGDPENLSSALRQLVNSIDPEESLSSVRTMDDVFYASVAQPRFTSQLLGLFAALAVFLAAVGLCGVMAYIVSQRTGEIGIRMALGAQRSDIFRAVIGEGVKIVLAGIATGFAASLVLMRFMASMLFGVSAMDPLTFAAVAVFLLCVALAACWIPARRASRVDPMVALRYE